MKLSTRLTVAMVGLVLMTATAAGLLTYINVSAAVEPHELERIDTHAHLLAVELEGAVRGARADALGFSAAVAAAEIVKAHIASRTDPTAVAVESEWRRVLGLRFVAELKAKPNYAQFRLIGVENGGRELIRVDRSGPDGAIRVVPDAELQSKGDTDYFKKAIALSSGQVYVSPIELNREHGVIETPHVPTLQTASPIDTPDGEPFGIVIINVDLRPAFASIRSNARDGRGVYVVNERGDYLVHSDPSREFAFELGKPARIQDSFPDFSKLLTAFEHLTTDNSRPQVAQNAAGEKFGVGWETAQLARGPHIAVIETVPYAQVMAPAAAVRESSLAGGLIAALCAVGFAALMARSLTRPLERMTKAVDAFSRGEAIEAPAGGGREISALGAAFTRMASELREKSDALARETRQRSRIFDTSLDLILVTDRRGRFVEVSPCSLATIGFRPEEMTGHLAIDFIFPDDLDKTRNEMRMARRGKELRQFECRYCHKDGRVISLDWSGVWSEADQQFYFMGRDITEQIRMAQTERETKETLAAVIDASPVAIVCLNGADRSVLVWSRAAEQMFGYSAEETLGRPYALVPQGGEAEYDDLIGRARSGETLRNVRVQRRRKDGSTVDISFDAAPMYEDGHVRAIAYALVDITERNKLEQQLRQSQKMDAIGQLTGGVAHDFNNMLTVITGTIDILGDAVADKPHLASIAKLISEAADRGAELTRNLLAFARKQPLQPRETNVNEVATESARLLRPTLGEDIEIVTRFSDDAWPALIDPAQLSTAILNLAINARDAMPEGGKLTLETANVILDEAYVSQHSEVSPGSYVMIAVSDTGTGIPAAIREKVFEPFFTTKGVGSGTGLGLSMVYGFVKQSGGHIKIYSEEGYGTTFKLYLPQADSPPATISETAPQLESGNETILVVEDDPLVLSSVTTQLEGLGYTTLSAVNAAEALAIVDSGAAFDLLFTDVIIPGPMNGRRLAEEIARRRSPLKVLFTSGYTENAIVHHGRLDRGVLLLVKPYRKQDLAKLLRQSLAANNTFPLAVSNAPLAARVK
ncbi:MAG TPA: PAS domain S-box protein [Pseudolabrys sp.]|nr:PAS domain S-box protein [Pseudolabrys sp.]